MSIKASRGGGGDDDIAGLGQPLENVRGMMVQRPWGLPCLVLLCAPVLPRAPTTARRSPHESVEIDQPVVAPMHTIGGWLRQRIASFSPLNGSVTG